jgi:hypothetical protein
MRKQNDIQQRREQSESQSSHKQFTVSDLSLRTRCGEVPEVDVHIITGAEFAHLIDAHESHKLTCATSLLSASIGFGVPLFSDVLSYRSVFIGLSAACFGAGITFLFFWLKERRSNSGVIAKIQARLKSGSQP